MKIIVPYNDTDVIALHATKVDRIERIGPSGPKWTKVDQVEPKCYSEMVQHEL